MPPQATTSPDRKIRLVDAGVLALAIIGTGVLLYWTWKFTRHDAPALRLGPVSFRAEAVHVTLGAGDRFTAAYAEGSEAISVSGKFESGNARIDSVRVHNGRATEEYESIAKAPRGYRETIQQMADLAANDNLRLRTKEFDGIQGSLDPDRWPGK